jgi:acyl carrier protein
MHALLGTDPIYWRQTEMSLSPTVLKYLHERANDVSAPLPTRQDDLYNSGILDSFELMSFVSLIEKEYQFSIPESEIQPDQFRTIADVEEFIKNQTAS